MGTQPIRLRDVNLGRRRSHARLLAPVRYLLIEHPEGIRYNFLIPGVVTVGAWIAYAVIEPKPALFGAAGLLQFARDLLIMAVPFMIGALAAVAMGAPGPHMDRRPIGVELYLDGRSLTLRQFVCYLLGYLSFIGSVTLTLVVAALLFHDPILAWTEGHSVLRAIIRSFGVFALFGLLSSLVITVGWGLYFLTDVVNNAD